ncbi:hypothetical protein AZI86_13635 [Bdellovibrio bacteriovorus]|uniref:Uncharacterized protein n=1 Tax=Bdellovibrio bacteriovorus TaxID=959 RepID=A0A150WJV0_BDEBC|nr:hypothetical protein [Bdellovibrio bacteriovorus]KYG63855.1 hypothetical protein AZI86_13635 [Bdellovibrio bacteriovorus]
MNPRLKSSKKWTAFPKEYSDQIQAVFEENFAQYLDDAELIIEGRIYQEEIMLRVGYLEKGRLSQANFEISMNYSREKQDAVKRIHNCVDAAASMMMDYVENEGQVDFPYTWKEVPFQGNKIYMQFNTENSSLEAQANKLLGVNEESLVQEDVSEEEEDALARAEERIETEREEDDVEFETDEDEDEDPAPRMFSGKSKKKKDDLH